MEDKVKNKEMKNLDDLERLMEKKMIDLRQVSSQLTIEDRLSRIKELAEIHDELIAERKRLGIQKYYELKVEDYRSEEENVIIEKILALDKYFEDKEGKHTIKDLKEINISYDVYFHDLAEARKKNLDRWKIEDPYKISKETDKKDLFYIFLLIGIPLIGLGIFAIYLMIMFHH